MPRYPVENEEVYGPIGNVVIGGDGRIYIRKINLLLQTSFILGNIFSFISWKIKLYYQ